MTSTVQTYELPCVPIEIDVMGRTFTLIALLDSGAEANFISAECMRRVGLQSQQAKDHVLSVSMADGTIKYSTEILGTKFRIGSTFRSKTTLHVLDIKHADVILSYDWMHRNKIHLDTETFRVYARYNDSVVNLPTCLRKKGSHDESVTNLCQMVTSKEVEHDIRQGGEWYQVVIQSAVQDSSSPDDLIQQRVENIMQQFQDVLVDEIPIGVELNRKFKAQIALKEGAKPVQKKPYPLPLSLEEPLKETITYLLERGIIQPSSSEFASPIIFTRKSDGSLRFCTDLRFVNDLVRHDNFPLPLISELAEKIGRTIQRERQKYSNVKNARLFISNADLARSFWQLEVNPDHRHITCFITKLGKFEFTRLPFGLIHSGNQFQKFLESVLTGIDNCFCYVDDVVIVSYGTLEQHEQLIRRLLTRFREEKLFVKKKKCNFFAQEIDFLGFRINEQGITVQIDKVDAMLARPAPTTVKELKSFLGVTNFYRKFVPGYTSVVLPLLDLLRKNARFEWLTVHQTAFEQLKKCLSSAPVLAYFDSSKETHLFVDASQTCIGAALTQKHADDYLPVAYFSKRLSSAQLNYSTREKECLGLISALLYFQYYTYGHKVTVHTDHNSLQYLLSQKNLQGRLFRWVQILADFQLAEVKYIPGEDNKIADFMSRPNENSEVQNHEELEKEFEERADLLNLDPSVLCVCTTSTEMVRNEATMDIGFNKNAMLDLVREGYEKSTYFKSILEGIRQNRRTHMESKSFYLKDGVLIFHDTLGRERVCIPEDARGKFLELVHDHSCHGGKSKTILRATRLAFWPRMNADILAYVNSCEECLQAKSFKQRSVAVPHSHAIPKERFEKISVDLLSGLPVSKKGNDSVLVFLDHFSGRVFLYPCKKSITSKQAARGFFETVYRNQGICKQILSDNGSIFNSTFWDEVFSLMGIDIRHSSVYYPQSNGRVEKFNSVIVDALRIFCMKYPHKTWDVYLTHLETVWNSTVRNASGLTPFEIIYGREIRTVVDFSVMDLCEDVDSIRENIMTALDVARDSMTIAAIDTERRLSKQRRSYEYKVGDKVMLSTKDLKLPETVPKMMLRFVGPFTIVEKVSDSTVKLELTSRFQRLKNTVFNVSKLRPYHIRDECFNTKVAPPDPIVRSDGEFYEVDRILARRGKGRRVQYLIRWKGYDNPASDSWLSFRELTTPFLRQLIREFNLTNTNS